MHRIDFSADELVAALLKMSESETVCLLDSCGVTHLGSHLLIAGIQPNEIHEITNKDAKETLVYLDEKLSGEKPAILTFSYDFGTKFERMDPKYSTSKEPDVFLAIFDALIVHDYTNGETYLTGDEYVFQGIGQKLRSVTVTGVTSVTGVTVQPAVSSNFTKEAYLSAIETIKERIRSGHTYQTNLTQQLTVKLPEGMTPQGIFSHLRKNHPAPFAAFITRKDSTVVSASPERFFRVEDKTITTSPIKGTRPRGKTKAEDDALKRELLASQKDIAENTMIVDLLRNDLGRVSEFGSVKVEKLCDLDEHPTLFHLVSTVSGELRPETRFSEILKALFPCGSITGAPKISTMKIIDELETAPRGLSMGAIGLYVPDSRFKIQSAKPHHSSLVTHHLFDLSVAIRTMTIRDGTAVFNVGGGVVIDSDPEKEYEESLLKAKALLDAMKA